MRGITYLVPCSVLALVACIGADYLLPDSSFIFRHCLGPACPTFSVPVNVNKPGVHHPVNCTEGEVIPHPSECQSLYVCNRNGTGIKLTCTVGYAFHQRLNLCVPKALVVSCGGVYCSPAILIGMVPDSQSCTRYYKCVYGVPMHYQCEPEHVYDEELGRCIPYSENDIPSCVDNEENTPENGNATTLTTTEAVTAPIEEFTTTEEPLSIPTTPDSPTRKL